jgi:hypothetical protein
MHRAIRLTSLPCLVLLAAGLLFHVAAQAPKTGSGVTASQDAAKKVMTLADYGKWNRVTSTALSPDGIL